MTEGRCIRTKTSANAKYNVFSFMVGAALMMFLGCAVKPDRATVQDAIGRYFQERKCKVMAIDVGRIASTPLSSKVYMGTEGYSVTVTSITLEIMEDFGPPAYYKKGKRLTFRNASVQIREAEGGTWRVTNISGITVL